MLSPVQSLVEEVNEVVTLPELYLRLRELIADESAGMPEFARLVQTDPSLCARVLRITNSAFFGLGTQIDSVERALTMIGTVQLHDLVLATSAISSFSSVPDELVDMQTFWRRSVHSAILSRLLALRCNALDSERHFLIALLHDLGNLALLMQRPDKMREVLSQLETDDQANLATVERGVFGFDYADLGSALLEAWRLPTALVEATRHHLEPQRGSEFPLETALLHLSAHAVGDYLNPMPAPDRLQFEPAAWHKTGLDVDEVLRLRSDSALMVGDTLRLFMPQPRIVRDTA